MKPAYTVTKKGQVTFPKELRELFGIKTEGRVAFQVDRKRRLLKVQPSPDVVELAGTLKTKKPFNPEKLRAEFERNYERI